MHGKSHDSDQLVSINTITLIIIVRNILDKGHIKAHNIILFYYLLFYYYFYCHAMRWQYLSTMYLFTWHKISCFIHTDNRPDNCFYDTCICHILALHWQCGYPRNICYFYKSFSLQQSNYKGVYLRQLNFHVFINVSWHQPFSSFY